MPSNFDHFDLTHDTVTATPAAMDLLLPMLVIANREAPDDKWRSIVSDTHRAVRDASQRDTEAPVTATFPKAAAAVMLRAVSFVDRLITITNEEIAAAKARREDSVTSGTEDLS